MNDRIPVQIVFSLRHWTPKGAKTWAADHGFELGHVKTDEYDVIVSLCERSSYVTTTMERSEFNLLQGVELVTAKARVSKLMRADGLQ